jgi:hypothetical protein
MSDLSIELSEKVRRFACAHCGEEAVTVWGSINEQDEPYATYYADLMLPHEQISARLTISLGGWGTDPNAERHWAYIEVRPKDESCAMMIREPKESMHKSEKVLGMEMARTEVLKSPLKDEFYAVADHIVFNDPAVKSYLAGEEVSYDGRDKPE